VIGLALRSLAKFKLESSSLLFSNQETQHLQEDGIPFELPDDVKRIILDLAKLELRDLRKLRGVSREWRAAVEEGELGEDGKLLKKGLPKLICSVELLFGHPLVPRSVKSRLGNLAQGLLNESRSEMYLEPVRNKALREKLEPAQSVTELNNVLYVLSKTCAKNSQKGKKDSAPLVSVRFHAYDVGWRCLPRIYVSKRQPDVRPLYPTCASEAGYLCVQAQNSYGPVQVFDTSTDMWHSLPPLPRGHLWRTSERSKPCGLADGANYILTDGRRALSHSLRRQDSNAPWTPLFDDHFWGGPSGDFSPINAAATRNELAVLCKNYWGLFVVLTDRTDWKKQPRVVQLAQRLLGDPNRCKIYAFGGRLLVLGSWEGRWIDEPGTRLAYCWPERADQWELGRTNSHQLWGLKSENHMVKWSNILS
jgi:hypothetical protein